MHFWMFRAILSVQKNSPQNWAVSEARHDTLWHTQTECTKEEIVGQDSFVQLFAKCIRNKTQLFFGWRYALGCNFKKEQDEQTEKKLENNLFLPLFILSVCIIVCVWHNVCVTQCVCDIVCVCVCDIVCVCAWHSVCVTVCVWHSVFVCVT